MSTYRNGLHGGGIFIDSKYPNEHHAHGYSYLGPGSRLDIRLDSSGNPKRGEEPINALDVIALSHDKLYKTAKDQYMIDGNKQKALDTIRKADDKFIQEAKSSNVQPLGTISAGIIKAKSLAEKWVYLIPRHFQVLVIKLHLQQKQEKLLRSTRRKQIQQLD